MPRTVISTDGLTKRFGGVAAVEALNLEVSAGQVYGFLGPNGAGKTTTIALALGLLHPTGGTVRVLGEEVRPDRTQVLRRVGSLVGAPGMVPSLSGADNLQLLARLHPSVDRERVGDILEFVGLTACLLYTSP